jgi:hypothetical protein
VDLAGHRAGAPPVLARPRHVRERAASRRRHRRRGRQPGGRAGGRRGLLRGLAAGRRPGDHDPDRRRLRGDAAATRLDERPARKRSGGGRRRRRGRRERRRGHVRVARPSRRPGCGRSGRLRRPARPAARARPRARARACACAVHRPRAAAGFRARGRCRPGRAQSSRRRDATSRRGRAHASRGRGAGRVRTPAGAGRGCRRDARDRRACRSEPGARRRLGRARAGLDAARRPAAGGGPARVRSGARSPPADGGRAGGCRRDPRGRGENADGAGSADHPQARFPARRRAARGLVAPKQPAGWHPRPRPRAGCRAFPPRPATPRAAAVARRGAAGRACHGRRLRAAARSSARGARSYHGRR